jgi:hypothetical protein
VSGCRKIDSRGADEVLSMPKQERLRRITMRSIDEHIARHLQDAAASGELSRARGYGAPMQDDVGWDETPQALRMPFKILKDAGIAPPEVELFHQRAALAAALRACTSPEERTGLMRQMSDVEQKIALRLETLSAYCRER